MHPNFPLALLPFISPWLFAAGAAATSIPVVIHLLNRRRFRVKNWAAMEFLMAAMRRNVRRLKMQRWLLLLLRALALLLLAAAIAQFTPAGAAEHFPVNVFNVVARRIGPMLRKFNRKALVRRSVHPGHKAFDDQPRANVQGAYLGQRARVKIPAVICFLRFRRDHGGVPVENSNCGGGFIAVLYRPCAPYPVRRLVSRRSLGKHLGQSGRSSRPIRFTRRLFN